MVSARARKTKAVAKVSSGADTNKSVVNGDAEGRKRRAVQNEEKAESKPAKRPTPSKKSKKKAKSTKKEEKAYEVEAIKGVMIKKGVTKYFIKWSGYPESNNTWEPFENLECEVAIRKFLANELAKADTEGADD